MNNNFNPTKFSIVGLLLALVVLVDDSVMFVKAVPMSSGACSLKILVDDYNNWHDLSEGFLYGFYKNPPDNVSNCQFCDSMAKSIAAL